MLIVNVEVEGNAKTKIFSSWIGLVDWIGDDMSQLKLIEYQTMHLDLSVDRERRGVREC